MRVHIIAAALPPQLDGIGDYTAHLAAELARSADVTVLTGAPAPAAIPGVPVEKAFAADDPRSVWNLVACVATDPPDWVLLQYNPFSYGRWGLNLHLPRVMERIKRRCPGTRVALMVHEPFVPVISPQFAVMATWQRWQLWALGRSADVLFFSIEFCTRQFRAWFPGKDLVHLPVGSNVPVMPITREESRARLGIDKNTLVLGMFGTVGSGRILDGVKETMKTLRDAGYMACLLYTGSHKEQIIAAVGAANVIADGPFPREEVSKRLAAIDIYLAAYAEGVTTRRTTLMVALQHGLAIVATRGPLTDAVLAKEDGNAFLLAGMDIPNQFQMQVLRLAREAKLRKQIAQGAATFYEHEFAWAKIVQKLHIGLTT